MLDKKLIALVFTSPTLAQDGEIVMGDKYGIPWLQYIPSHVQRIRELIKDQTALVGRKTWELSFMQRFLRDSCGQTLVLTQKPKRFPNKIPNVIAVDTFEKATKFARSEILWVLGGVQVFNQALPTADFIYQTMACGKFKGNIFFSSFKTDRFDKPDFKHFKIGGIDSPKDEIDSHYLVFKRK